jgi:hypothetical protein
LADESQNPEDVNESSEDEGAILPDENRAKDDDFSISMKNVEISSLLN